MNRIKILNVEIDNISQEELLAQLKKGRAGDSECGSDREDADGQGVLRHCA